MTDRRHDLEGLATHLSNLNRVATLVPEGPGVPLATLLVDVVVDQSEEILSVTFLPSDGLRHHDLLQLYSPVRSTAGHPTSVEVASLLAGLNAHLGMGAYLITSDGVALRDLALVAKDRPLDTEATVEALDFFLFQRRQYDRYVTAVADGAQTWSDALAAAARGGY